jgi:hypothetical protein
MNRNLRNSVFLVSLGFLLSTGCMEKVVRKRGPAKTAVLGVTVEFAPDVGEPEEPMEAASGERSATIKYEGITAEIDDMNLSVNGRRYGVLKKGDHVLLDKDRVEVNGEARAAIDK